MPLEAGPSSRIRRNTACIACRDSKVKCDAHLTGGQPCTKCAKLNIECVVDRSHRRTTKRSKLEELVREVRSIKQAVAQPSSLSPASGALPSLLQSPPDATSSPLGSSSRKSLQEPPPPLPRILSSRPPVAKDYRTAAAVVGVHEPAAARGPAEPRALNSRVFSSELIDYYFERYFDHFHPFLPVVRCRDPNACYQAAPVLFWAIISTAARRHDDDVSRRSSNGGVDGDGGDGGQELLQFLADHVPPLIWAAVSDVPISLPVIQALLLVAAWPLMLRAAKDPSLILAGIASNACLHLGLHTGRGDHPEFGFQGFPMRITDEEALFAWAGVNIISQRIAVYMGLPSAGVLFNKATEGLLDDETPPVRASRHFKTQLGHADFSSRANKIIYVALEAGGGMSHHQVAQLEEEFEALNGAVASSAEDVDHFSSLCTLMEIQACYLMPPPGYDNHAVLKRNIIKAFTTAQRAIRLALQLQREMSFLLCAPHYVSRYILAALCITTVILLSPYLDGNDGVASAQGATSSIVVDKEAVMRESVRAFRECSVMEGDIASRISKMVESYWSVRHRLPPGRVPLPRPGTGEFGTRINNIDKCSMPRRLGTGLTYECLRLWRRDLEQFRPPQHQAEPILPGGGKQLSAEGLTGTTNVGDPGPNAMDDPFQRIDWDAFMDFDWGLASDYPMPP